MSNRIPPFSRNNFSEDEFKKGKADYEFQNRDRAKLGKKGEELVLSLERNELCSQGRSDLANKVKQVSLESDIYGYDIHSYDSNGKDKYIEVKTTRTAGKVLDFFLTDNELEKALSTEDYYLYYVTDVLSSSPKVYNLGNPFREENDSVLIKKPMVYKVRMMLE